MSELPITIRGASYRIRCEEGCEQAAYRLGRQFHDYVAQVAQESPHIGDAHLLVLAGMRLLDEINRLRETLDNQSVSRIKHSPSQELPPVSPPR